MKKGDGLDVFQTVAWTDYESESSDYEELLDVCVGVLKWGLEWEYTQ